ncbi:class I SAM-dependent methyltransferase [Oerskovia flava]|uniref:class I SAM-dependent methyltransferase n=1 Tax=Oerskovia flava TaxID=2986422 RepID=UPI00223F338E|nr:class I SAM-dependent methyltransferase [Oerskovia sp. JB1-3-2]
MSTDQQTTTTAEAFAERLFASTLGAFEILSVYLGDRLGWYRALAGAGPLTSAELAASTATQERYAREWLEQQATSGLLVVAPGDPTDGAPPGGPEGPHLRRFALPAAHAEVLTDEHSLSYVAPLSRFVAAAGPQLEHLLESYRHGGGVSWEQLGEDAREAQAAVNRPWFERELAPALAGVPQVHDVLSRPGARVLDVGCGLGWSTLALAQAYPEASLHGVDVDTPSIAAARTNARDAGLTDRVTFHQADAAESLGAEPFDAAFAFECVHDMPRPVEVLEGVRRAVRPDGVVVVMDEAVADDLQAPGDDVERVMYGYSILFCLPDGLSSSPSAGTGTVIRPPVLRRYALEAGFTGVEVLPIEDFAFFRFYRLT